MPRLRMQEARRCLRIRAWPRSYASNKHMQFKADALASNKHIGIWGYRRQFTRSQNTIFFSKNFPKKSTQQLPGCPGPKNCRIWVVCYSGTVLEPLANRELLQGVKKKTLPRTKNLRLRRIFDLDLALGWPEIVFPASRARTCPTNTGICSANLGGFILMPYS